MRCFLIVLVCLGILGSLTMAKIKSEQQKFCRTHYYPDMAAYEKCVELPREAYTKHKEKIRVTQKPIVEKVSK